MGELLSIREVVKRFDQDKPVYTVERPQKKPSEKVSAKAYRKGTEEKRRVLQRRDKIHRTGSDAVRVITLLSGDGQWARPLQRLHRNGVR